MSSCLVRIPYLLAILFLSASLTVAAAAKRYVLPQVVAGQGFVCYIDIVNNGESLDSGTISFFQSNGTSVFVLLGPEIGSAFPYSLARGASYSGRVTVPSGIVIGYVIIESTNSNSNLAISLRYHYSGSGSATMLSVPGSAPANAVVFPAVSDAEEQTAIAFVNPNASSVKVLLELRDQPGAIHRTTNFTLFSKEHRAKYLKELIARLGTFHGSVVVRFVDPITQANVEGSVLPILDQSQLLASVPIALATPPIDQMLARCPSSAEVSTINAGFTLSFEADPTSGKFVCTPAQGSVNLTEMQRRVYQTLLAMKNLQFAEPLPWTSKSLYTWLNDSLTGIRFRDDITYSYCCDPANTINVRVSSNSYLLLTTRWVEPQLAGGLMDLAVLFAHEARHANGYPHTCGTDDNTIAEMGAWGIQYYLTLWLSQEVDKIFVSDPSYLQAAKNHSDMIKNSSFCVN